MCGRLRILSSIWIVVAALILLGMTPDLASAVGRQEIHHSEELVFQGAVETVIYHSEGATYDHHEKFIEALEARPREMVVAGRALLDEWRIYRGYDRGHLFLIKAPIFWRDDWRMWKHWDRWVLGDLRRSAQFLLSENWRGFTKENARVWHDERKRAGWGRLMHLELGG